MSKEQQPFLSARLEGPAIKSSRMRFEDFLLLGQEMVRAVRRVALVLAGHADSLATTRPPDEIRAAISLDLVGFTQGSQAVVALFDRSETQVQSFGGMDAEDFGSTVFASWLEGMAAVFGEQETLPPGYDVGVLMAVRDLGNLFDKGVAHIDFSLNHRPQPFQVRFDPGKRQRVQQRISQPREGVRTVEGRLMMADFKEENSKVRIEPSVGSPVGCKFNEALRDAVYENILHFVKATGVAEADPITGKIKSFRLTDILQLEEPETAVQQPETSGTPSAGAFWECPSIDELAESQQVEIVESLDDLLGGWPEDELNDGFEMTVAEWRKSELEPSE